MSFYKVVALSEPISESRNQKRGREESNSAADFAKRVRTTIPTNAFFKARVLDHVLQYTAYPEQKRWVEGLDKKSLLKMAKLVLPKKVQNQLSNRISESAGRLPGELNRYDLALIRLLRRYYTFVDHFKDGDDREDNDYGFRKNSIVYKNSQDISRQAAFGFGINCRYFELPGLMVELSRIGRIGMEHIDPRLCTYSMCLALVKANHGSIRYVPIHLITEEMSRIVVSRDGAMLRWIPARLKTKALCELAVDNSIVFILDQIPDEFKTRELCLKQVQKSGFALEHVPYELKTEEMCDAALASAKGEDQSVLSQIPEPLRTVSRCVAAFSGNQEWDIPSIPRKIRLSVLKELIRYRGEALQFIPKRSRKPNLCHRAVRLNPNVIVYVPEEYRDSDMYIRALESNGLFLRHIPKSKITAQFVVAALRQNLDAFEHVPEAFKKKKLCIPMLKCHLDALKSIPLTVLDDDEFRAAAQRRILDAFEKGQSLSFLPPAEVLNEEICIKLVEKNGQLLSAPQLESFRTEAVCLAALKQNPRLLEVVPDAIKSDRLCAYAMIKEPSTIRYIPEKFQTTGFFSIVVSRNPSAILAVPERFRTPQMYCTAAEKDPYMLTILPINLREELSKRM